MAKANNSDDSTQILRSIGVFLVCPQLRTENGELRTVWKRHTGVLEETPSSKAALWDAHGDEDVRDLPRMRYFSRINPLTDRWRYGNVKERRRPASQPGVGGTLHCVGPDRDVVLTRALAFLPPLSESGGFFNCGSGLATLSPHQSGLSCRQNCRIFPYSCVAAQVRAGCRGVAVAFRLRSLIQDDEGKRHSVESPHDRRHPMPRSAQDL